VILGDSLDPREWARLLWRERWSWAAYFALDAAALINYYTRYYVTMPRPPAGQVIHFVEIALVQSFTPALFGVAHPPTPGTAAVAAAGLLFCLLATVVLYLRPRAWRCLVLALIAFLLSLLPLGLNRIRLFGVYVGAELYYQQSAQFMFLVLTAFALSPRWGGRRDRGSTRIRLPRVRARVLVPVALAVAAVYGALYVSSVDSLRDSSWEPRTARSYFDTFLADAARVRASTGSDPNLIDTTVQGNMMPASFYPYNLYSFFFAVVTPHLRYDQGAGPSYVVGLSGALQRVRFAPAATGLLRRPACVSAGVEQRLRVKLDRTVRFPASVNGRAAAVEASYRLPGRTDVGVLRAPAGSPPVPVDFEQHFWGPGSGTGIAVIGGPATIGEVDLDLRGPGCIDHLAVGSFVPQAR
jgi:hypothetical protein